MIKDILYRKILCETMKCETSSGERMNARGIENKEGCTSIEQFKREW